jgi:hypothetical protein
MRNTLGIHRERGAGVGNPDFSWAENDTWDPEIEARFEAKLRRARLKDRYLLSQAKHLARAHPDVSLLLIDRFYALPDQSMQALAHHTRARALRSLGRHEDALSAYSDALVREAERGPYRTSSYLDLPMHVALARMRVHYPLAVDVLCDHAAEPMWPVERFKWHAAFALVAIDSGDAEGAGEHARLALDAAGTRESVFRYHRGLGCVGKGWAPVIERLLPLGDA